MSDQNDELRATKRELSRALLDHPGVAGVGLRGDAIVVYITDTGARERIAAATQRIAPSTPVVFEVSGALRKHEES